MNRRLVTVTRRLLLAAVCFAALAGIGFACKQQEGERCQIDSDCDTGLVCNQATNECAGSSSTTAIDAMTPEFIDADDPPIDAPDAPDDAEPDA